MSNAKGNCPFAIRHARASIRCEILRDRQAKWDFCTKQYFCRASNRYEVSREAGGCEIKKSKEGE